MRLRSLALVPFLAASVAALAAVNCGGTVNNVTGDAGAPLDAGPPVEAAPPVDPQTNPDAVGATTSAKVDVLFVVDNSASMGDKATLLASSIGTLLRKVATAGDMHVGVISSSLGGAGGDVCQNSGTQNTLAHLATTGPGGVVVQSAPNGVLAYGGAGSGDINAVVAAAEQLVNGVGQSGCGL